MDPWVVSAIGCGLLFGWAVTDSVINRTTAIPSGWGYGIDMLMAFVAGMLLMHSWVTGEMMRWAFLIALLSTPAGWCFAVAIESLRLAMLSRRAG